MARNRLELEENRKKDALEAVINAAKAGAAYLEPAKATVQKNQSKKTAAKSTGSAKTTAAGGKSTRTAQTNPVRAAAVNANQAAARQVQQAATRKSTIPTFLQPKTTRIQPIIRPAMVNPVNVLTPRVSGTGRTGGGFSGGGGAVSPLPAVRGTTRAQRQADLDQLTANSVAWHFADDAQKRALFEANNAIRQKYNLAYLPGTGETYNNAGVNLSAPVAEEVRTQQSYNAQTPLSVLGHNTMAGVAGINRGFYSTLDFLLPDVITPEFVQDKIDAAKRTNEDIQEKVRRYNYERGGKIGGAIGDLYQSALGMIPQAVIAVMSGGTSAAAQGGSTLAGAADDIVSNITRQLTKNAGYMSSFASTVGTDYERAKAAGASDAEAAFSAILSSAATAGIETMGGIDVPQGSASRLRNALNTALEEGSEEVLQDLAQSIVEKGTYNPDKAWAGENGVFDLGRALQNFGAGAILGGGFGAARTPVRPQIQGTQAAIRPNIQQAPVDASAAPVRAGRATTIQSPYTGKMPQNAGAEAQTRPLQIGKADVEGAQQAIFASQQGGTFARTMKRVLQNIFQQNGGARTVTVQGVTFDGRPYDVVLGNKVAAKVASDPNMTAEKLAIFSRLDQAVQTAEYVGSGYYGKNKAKAPNVIRYDYFEKPLSIAGQDYIMAFDVEVFRDTNNFRTYKVINEIDLAPIAASRRSTTDGLTTAVPSLSDNSIPQTNGNSNTPVAQNDPIRPIIQPAQGVSPDSSVGAAQRIQPVISTFGENTVGAAQSGFTPKQNVSKVYSNTFQNSGIFNNAEQELLHIRDQDGDALYDVVSEKQSIQNAKDRLDIDFEGELTDLPNKPNFSGEDNDTAMGIIHQLRNEARESGDFSEVAKWVKMVKEKGTEGGQFIQSFAKYTRTPEGAMVQGQREIDAALKLWEKTNPKRIKKLQEQGYLIWTEADMQKVADYMEQAHDASLDTYDGKMYEAKAMHVIAERIPSTAKDKVVSLLMDNMLGNFRTLVARNAGGNALFSIPEGLREQLVAAPLDALTSAITKQRTTYFSPIKKTGQWMKGFGKGSKEMAGDIRHGVHTARSGEDASIRAQQRTFRNKGLGRVGNAYDALVGTALEVGDRPFYEAAYAAKMQDLETARRKGQLTKDFDGKDFDSYAPQVARQAALEAVFQNNGLVAQGMTNVANAIGQISRGVTGTSALRQSALPFTKTPGNLAERAIEYSPLGALKNSIGTFNEVRRGTFNQQRFVNETSRNIVGTLIFLAANGLVESDIVTGALSDDRDEKEAQKNAGMQEYAVKIGDNYYSYSWIPVVGPALAGAADFYQALNSMDKNTLAAAWDAAGGYVQSAVFEQSALSGLEEMFSGYGSTVDNIGSTLASVSSQLVPSIVRQIAAATDPYERQTYVSGDTLQSQLNYLKSSIPGLRQTLPIKRDEQGNEKLASQGRGLGARIAENMFLPAKVTADQSNAVRDELMRLKQATGLTTQFQTKVTYAVENNGEKKLLTPFQSMEYQKYYGQTSTQAIQELMNSGAYSTLSDSEKVKVISEINSYAKAFADSQFIDKEFDTSQQKAQEAQNMGIGIGNYYAFTNGARKIQEANKGAADSTEKNVAGIVDLLESAGFRDMSESQKDYLFDSAGYSAMLNPYHISEVETAAENNPYYQKLDGENKYYFRSLANEYEDAVDNGKALDGWIAKAKLAADNGVVEPYQFVALKLALLYADTDQNGSYKQSEVTAAINKLSGLTQQQKAYLWQAQNKSWKRNPFGYASVYWPETEKQDNSPSAVISRRTGGMGGTK